MNSLLLVTAAWLALGAALSGIYGMTVRGPREGGPSRTHERKRSAATSYTGGNA